MPTLGGQIDPSASPRQPASIRRTTDVRNHRSRLDRSGRGASSRDVLARMTDVLRHRGPDDAGSYHSDVASCSPATASMPGVALGHRRLSIIDVAGGHQPLSNEDGIGLDRLQRRDLQLPRAAPAARRRRPPLSHALRHRNASSISTRTKGSDFLRASRMACSRWPSGTPTPAAGAGPRSAGQEAARLSARAGPAAVRQRAEEPAAKCRASRARSIRRRSMSI